MPFLTNSQPTFSDTTALSTTVTWRIPNGIQTGTTYKVLYRLSERLIECLAQTTGANFEELATKMIPATGPTPESYSITIEGLAPYTKYQVRIEGQVPEHSSAQITGEFITGQGGESGWMDGTSDLNKWNLLRLFNKSCQIHPRYNHIIFFPAKTERYRKVDLQVAGMVFKAIVLLIWMSSMKSKRWSLFADL